MTLLYLLLKLYPSFFTWVRHWLMLCFVETSIFTKRVKRLLTDDDFASFQAFLSAFPNAGTIISGSGGIRKIRWSKFNQGKRSGLRVLYYWHEDSGVIRLLFIFAKQEQDNLTYQQLKMLRGFVEKW